MVRGLGRAFWWVVTVDRPRWLGDYLALAMLPTLLLLGALALAWPWVSAEVPRALAAGLAVVQATLAAWLKQLLTSLPRWG